jgi:hypothetical protein
MLTTLKDMNDDESFDQGTDYMSSCGSGHHDMCVHIVGDTPFLLLTGSDAATFSPEGSSICRCPCHGGCPLADQDDGSGWPERCECEGTLLMMRLRRGHPDRRPDIGSTVRTSVERSCRTRRARKAAEARAPGLNREALGTVLHEEWTKEGLNPPTEPLRGMELDRLLRPSTRHMDDARLYADVGVAMVKLPFKIASMFQRASASDVPPDPAEMDRPSVYRIQPRVEAAEVILDAGAVGRLSGFGEDGVFATSVLRTDKVELRLGEHDALEVWEYAPATADDRPARRLGYIRDEDALPYRRPVTAAVAVGQAAVCEAVRSKTVEARFRLHLAAERRS